MKNIFLLIVFCLIVVLRHTNIYLQDRIIDNKNKNYTINDVCIIVKQFIHHLIYVRRPMTVRNISQQTIELI